MSQGDIRYVSVPVSTVWSAPDRARALDARAVAPTPDCPGWAAALSRAERADLDGRTESQLLLGEPVRVAEERDGWARVVVPGQQAPTRDPIGYPGWVPAAHLAPSGPPPHAEHCLIARTTVLRDAPGGEPALRDVAPGTRLAAAGEAVDGWRPLTVPGHREPLWVAEVDLAPMPAPAPDGATVLAHAERLVGTRYLWGGLTPFGVDCSGLVYLAHRLAGAPVPVPRNASDQHQAATPVPLGSERPGDLYFFAREGRPAHHVGFVAGDGLMVDACGVEQRVLRHPLTADRRATLVGAGRFTTDGGAGPVGEQA